MKERLPEVIKAKGEGTVGEGVDGFLHIRIDDASAELEKFGFLKKEYIDHLFESNKFIYGLSFYSTFYSLSKFINSYID